MKKSSIAAGCVAAALTFSAPASASVFTYNQNNGAVLTINTATRTGTLIGADINTTFTSPDFANFTGGRNPTGSFNLATLDGYRLINGQRFPDNTSHPQRLIFGSNGSTNLWSFWGTGSQFGDYITRIIGYTPPPPVGSTGGSTGGGSTGGGSTDIPAPGMLALFGIGAAAVAFRRRRKKAIA